MLSRLVGAVGAAVNRVMHLHAMTDNAAVAVRAYRRQRMNRALEAIESMRLTIHDDLE